jgi:hypothetical protein
VPVVASGAVVPHVVDVAAFGGRCANLTQRQLDQAQRMYDSGQHTVAEIAATLHVNRYLARVKDGTDCVLVVLREHPQTTASAGASAQPTTPPRPMPPQLGAVEDRK